MLHNKIFILKIICVALIVGESVKINAKTVQKRGVMDNFGEGLKYAGQMFGINTAADVANLVAKAFSSTTSSRNKSDFMSIFSQQKVQKQASGEEEPQGYATQQEPQYDGSAENRPPAKEEVNMDFSTTKLITNILRMIGFDATKLGALAINALIMVAQAIGSTLMSATKPDRFIGALNGGLLSPHRDDAGPEEPYATNDQQPRALRDGTPIDWFLQKPSRQMKRLLNDAMDTKLPDKITHMIESFEGVGDEGACLKMLMCKSSPFIWGMQKSLSKRLGKAPKKAANATAPDYDDYDEQDEDRASYLNARSFFKHLPSLAEYRQHGEQCEQRFANYCNTTRLYHAARKRKAV